MIAGTTDYAILRTKKFHSHFEISQAVAHNYRLIPTPHIINPKPVQWLHGSPKAPEVAKEILSKQKVRSNAVYGIEILLSASPTYFRDDPEQLGVYDFMAYEALECAAVSWLAEYFGEENIISSVGHLDESTPHFHAIVVPIDPKGKLNARHFTGGADKLRAMQDSWAKKVEHLGLIRGNPSPTPKQHVPVSLFHKIKDISKKALAMAGYSYEDSKPTDGIAKRKRMP